MRLAGGLGPHDGEHPSAGLSVVPGAQLYRHDLRKAKRLVAKSGLTRRKKRVTVWNHDVAGDLPFTEYLVSRPEQARLHAHEQVVTGERLLVDAGRTATKAQIGFANWFQDYPHPLDWFGSSSTAARRQPRTTTTTRTSTSPWVNREIEVADAAAEAHARVDRAMAAPRSQGDAARPVGAVPQPRGDRLLQRRV